MPSETAPPASHARRVVKLVLRMAATAALLYWAFRQVDPGQFGQVVKTARWPFLVAAWFCAALFSLVQSAALRIVLRKQGCDVRLNTLFGASTVTAFYSLMLPGLLSTGVKWYILKRDTGRGSHVLSSMVYNQLALFVAMSVIGLTALFVNVSVMLSGSESEQVRLLRLLAAGLLILIVLVSALLLNARTGQPVIRMLKWSLRPWPEKLRIKGQDVLQKIAAFQSAGLTFHGLVAAINVFNILAVATAWYACAAAAASISVPLGLLVCLCTSVYVLSKLPITLANLGLREATLVAVLTGYGIEASSALLMSMALFSSQIFMAAIGAGYQLRWSGREASSTGGREAPN